MAHSSTVSASLLSFFIHFFHHLRSRVTPSQGLHSSTLPPSSCIYPRSSHLLVRIECTGLMALSFSALPCALPLQSGGVGILGRRQIPSSLSPSPLSSAWCSQCSVISNIANGSRAWWTSSRATGRGEGRWAEDGGAAKSRPIW